MSLSVVYTRAQLGIDAPLVTAEIHLANGLPCFTIVGLPETAVKESKDRVRSAIVNSHFEFPTKRITVNLAPADLPKEGGRYDLAIAIGILAASGQVPNEQLAQYEFIGELALSGIIRPVKGVLPAALACAKQERRLISPVENNDEVALSQNFSHFSANNLLSVSAHLHQRAFLPNTVKRVFVHVLNTPDMKEVKGQAQAKRALEVAAAGGHNLLFFGPPGSGKSMLASRLPSILPSLTTAETLEVAAIRSISGSTAEDWYTRPFRSPHHTASAIAIVGGGTNPKPGEITLAHRGVLFLDELPEYPRSVLEVLREPIENGKIHISRARGQVTYPAKFQLLAAMNPCPCGFYGDKYNRCRCTPTQVARYRGKISGPLLDRMDMHINVDTLPISDLHNTPDAESSAAIKERVIYAHNIQLERQGKVNSHLQSNEIEQHCELHNDALLLLTKAMEQLKLSARSYHRIIKLARTIADLCNSHTIEVIHISEALAYRALDRPIEG